MRRPGCASLAVLASCLAAAPPANAAPTPAPPLDVLLVVDVSASVDGLAPGSVGGLLRALPEGTRLAVIAFAEDAAVVRPLSAIAGPADLSAAEREISGLAFRGRRTELGEGLLLALLEGVADEQSAGARRVVLLSDGRLDPGAGRAAIPDALRSLRNEILPAFTASGMPIFTVARGAPNLALLREIAGRTGGRCALAPDGAALEDALALLAASFASDAESAIAASPHAAPAAVSARAAKARAPRVVGSGAFGPVVAPALAALLVAALVAILAAVHRRRTDEPRPDASPPDPAVVELNARRLELEDRLVAAWEAERVARSALHGLAGGVFLALDHLDRAAAGSPGDDRLRWFGDKLDRVLADAGIDEIRVGVGNAFDGGVHRHVGERDADLPRGAVLAVTRKGYVRRGEGGRDEACVLRPAEVVLSSGRTAQVN